MITGRRAFERDTAIETISSVLSSEPRPIASLAPRTPATVVQIVERCLAKILRNATHPPATSCTTCASSSTT